MKNKRFFMMLPILATVMLSAFKCGNGVAPVDENVSACGVNDPLQNIEWLREFCEGLNDSQNLLSVNITLYKAINTDENVFLIGSTFLPDPPLWYIDTCYEMVWKNCMGQTIFYIPCPGTPPNPDMVEDFMADKELIAELFNFVKP